MEQADEATEFGYNPQRKEKLNKGNALYNFRGFVICLWTDRIEDEISNDHGTMFQGLSSNLLGVRDWTRLSGAHLETLSSSSVECCSFIMIHSAGHWDHLFLCGSLLTPGLAWGHGSGHIQKLHFTWFRAPEPSTVPYNTQESLGNPLVGMKQVLKKMSSLYWHRS